MYELSPSDGVWTERILYNFCSLPNCSDGEAPIAGVTFDGKGNLYGTTSVGGFIGKPECPGDEGCGTVFVLMRPTVTSNWKETVIHSFTGKDSDGFSPNQAVIFDPNGNLYGTTGNLDFQYYGSIFQLTPSNGGWTEIFRTFDGSDGRYPNGLLWERGSVYGTTIYGGSNNGGVVFEITP